ncbi:MAG: hypothetical protein ACI841_003875 [Planctomycetota bacterium]|jgi:hypothetical protein
MTALTDRTSEASNRARSAFSLSPFVVLALACACQSTGPQGELALDPWAEAIRVGDATEIVRLAEAGAGIDQPVAGELPLHFASRQGSVVAIESLLALGARSSAVGPEGRTALHVAVQQDQLDAARALLANGARSDASDQQGDQPLHLSSTRAMDELLISHGAILDAYGAGGTSAMDVLRERGEQATTKMMRDLSQGRFWQIPELLGSGADAGAIDSAGRSAILLTLLGRGEVLMRVFRGGGEELVRLTIDELSGVRNIASPGGRIAGLIWRAGTNAEEGQNALRALIRAGADLNQRVVATGLWMLFPGITADMSQFDTTGEVHASLGQFARGIGQTDVIELLTSTRR